MAIIRQADARRLAEQAIALDLGDLRRQGEAIIARAQEQASVIVAQARAQREDLLRGAEAQGRAQGLEVGRREGLEQGRAQGRTEALAQQREALTSLHAAWSGALDQFERTRGMLLEDAREDVVRLAVSLAERIVKRAIALDPSLVISQVEATLAILAQPTRATILVHPDDEPLVREAMPQIASRLANARDAALATDAGLSRGSCVVRTQGGGVLDAEVVRQLERICEALLPQPRGAATPEAQPAVPDSPRETT